MKILIAGFGSIGRRHFRNLYALGERDFIFLRSKRSTLPDEEIAAFPLETDLDSALAHKPDVVIVSNPTALHLDVAIPAAEAGCHLFIEKPLSNAMDRVDALQDAVLRGKGRVLVGFQFRYHPQLTQIKTLLENDQLGDLVSVRVEWGEYLPDWHPWEDYRKGYSARKDLGGGVVLTLCHPLDYLRWLLGEVADLCAFTNRVNALGIDVEGIAEIGLRFTNGVIGSVHLDYIQRPHKHSLVIVGSKGKISWDAMKGDLEVYREAEDSPVIFGLPPGFERNHLFKDQMQHLIAVVQWDEAPYCSLSDGIMVQRLVMGVHESAQSKKMMSW
jgi:predicted dehydrogenase